MPRRPFDSDNKPIEMHLRFFVSALGERRQKLLISVNTKAPKVFRGERSTESRKWPAISPVAGRNGLTETNFALLLALALLRADGADGSERVVDWLPLGMVRSLRLWSSRRADADSSLARVLNDLGRGELVETVIGESATVLGVRLRRSISVAVDAPDLRIADLRTWLFPSTSSVSGTGDPAGALAASSVLSWASHATGLASPRDEIVKRKGMTPLARLDATPLDDGAAMFVERTTECVAWRHRVARWLQQLDIETYRIRISMVLDLDVDEHGGVHIERVETIFAETPIAHTNYSIYVDKPGRVELVRLRAFVVTEAGDVALPITVVPQRPQPNALHVAVLFGRIVLPGETVRLEYTADAENYMADFIATGFSDLIYTYPDSCKVETHRLTFRFPAEPAFANVQALVTASAVSRHQGLMRRAEQSDSGYQLVIDVSAPDGSFKVGTDRIELRRE